MQATLRAALLVCGKDLRVEARTREITVSAGLFALLVAVLTSLSFFVDDLGPARTAPGVLWIAIAFSGVLVVGRSWSRERENDAFRALLLSPIPRASIFVGKTLSTVAVLALVELLLVPVVGILFRADLFAVAGPLVVLLFLGTLGFAAAGTLFGAMSVKTRARELVLSVVLFPLVAPALLSAVVGTRELLAAAPLDEVVGWMRVLLAYDLVVVTLGWILFEPLTSD